MGHGDLYRGVEEVGVARDRGLGILRVSRLKGHGLFTPGDHVGQGQSFLEGVGQLVILGENRLDARLVGVIPGHDDATGGTHL
ncbi:hypothetical protein D3C87_1317240 [compost metagenome]